MNDAAGSILFISHDASRTGAPIFLLRFLQWLRARGRYSFRTLIGRYGELAPSFEALGPVEWFEPEPALGYKALRKLGLHEGIRRKHRRELAKRLAGCGIRLIYSNTSANGRILEFLSFLKCPVITHVHELESVISGFGEENARLLKEHTSQFIAVSECVRQNLIQRRQIGAEKVRLVPGFIPDPPAVAAEAGEARTSVRKELGIPEGAPIVCGAGSTDYRKGIDLLVPIAQEMKRLGSQAHLVWAGGRADLLARFREQVRLAGLADMVHLTGPKADLTRYYDAADVFLLPSREDPFPLVMLEAAARGLPMVCFSGSGGGPEFASCGGGIVVPAFDTGRMAREIEGLLSDAEKRRAMGQAGKEQVLRRHTIGSGAPQLEQIMREQLCPGADGSGAEISPQHPLTFPKAVFPH